MKRLAGGGSGERARRLGEMLLLIVLARRIGEGFETPVVRRISRSSLACGLADRVDLSGDWRLHVGEQSVSWREGAVVMLQSEGNDSAVATLHVSEAFDVMV